MPSVPQNLRSARQLLREWLTAVRWPGERVEAVVVAVNEAMTNAIEHAHPSTSAPSAPLPAVEVHGQVRPAPDRTDAAPAQPVVPPIGGAPPQVRIEITDRGRWHLADTELDQHADRGWGLHLMRTLMDEVLVDSVPGGGTRVILIATATVCDSS